MLWNTKCKHGTHTMCPLLLIRMKIMWVKNNTNLNKWTWNVHRHAAHSGCNSVWSSMCVKEQKKKNIMRGSTKQTTVLFWFFFPGLHGLKRKWLILTMQQGLIWRGCTGACRKDANGITRIENTCNSIWVTLFLFQNVRLCVFLEQS